MSEQREASRKAKTLVTRAVVRNDDKSRGALLGYIAGLEANQPSVTAAPKRAKNPVAPVATWLLPRPVSPALGAIVGNKPLPRTEITKKLWAYIRKHGLQDSVERRMINADDKLKPVFGGKKRISMFEMTKCINKHVGEYAPHNRSSRSHSSEG